MYDRDCCDHGVGVSVGAQGDGGGPKVFVGVIEGVKVGGGVLVGCGVRVGGTGVDVGMLVGPCVD